MKWCSENSNNLETATKNFASTSAALDGTISDVAELTKMLNGKFNKKFNEKNKVNLNF